MAGKTKVLKAILTSFLLALSPEVTALQCISPGVSCDFPLAEYRFEGNLHNSSVFLGSLDARNTAFQTADSYIYGLEGNQSYSYAGFSPYNAVEFGACLFRQKDVSVEWNMYVDKKAVLESSESRNVIWSVELGYRQGESAVKKAEVYIERDPGNSANLQIVFMYPRLNGVSYLKASEISSDGWYNIKIGWKNAAGISAEPGSEIMLDVYDYDYADGILGNNYACSEIWYREIDMGTYTRGDEAAYLGNSAAGGVNFLKLKVDDLVFWNCYLYEINPTPTRITDVTPRPTIAFELTPVPQETNIPAPADTDTCTQTPTPTETYTHSPTETYTHTQTDTYTHTTTETYTHTPTETYTHTQTDTYTHTPTETYTHTPTETYTHTPTETYTHTTTETYTETPTETYAETQVETHAATQVPALTATPVVTETTVCRISYRIKIGKQEYGWGQLRKNPELAALIIRTLELEDLLSAKVKDKNRIKMELVESEGGGFEYSIRGRNIEIVVADKAGCLYKSAAEFNGAGRIGEKGKRWLNVLGSADEVKEVLISSVRAEGGLSAASFDRMDERHVFNSENCYNFPNPFRYETTVRFSVPVYGRADILIYDVSGEQVYSASMPAEPGVNNVTIKAAGKNGNPLASGVYVMKVLFGDEAVTKKMVIMK